MFSFLVPVVLSHFFPSSSKCHTALDLCSIIVVGSDFIFVYFSTDRWWVFFFFCESPLFPCKDYQPSFSTWEKKSDIFSELFSDELRREEQMVCAHSVLFTAWHVQVPVRRLQSFSIKEKNIRPAKCCLTLCIYLSKLDEKSALDKKVAPGCQWKFYTRA